MPAANGYAMFLRKARYVPTTFPRQSLFNLLEVGPAGLSNLELKLLPQTVLAGVLANHTGEPIERATVSAYRLRHRNGKTIHLPLPAHSYTNPGELRESFTVVLPPKFEQQVSSRLSGPKDSLTPDTIISRRCDIATVTVTVTVADADVTGVVPPHRRCWHRLSRWPNAEFLAPMFLFQASRLHHESRRHLLCQRSESKVTLRRQARRRSLIALQIHDGVVAFRDTKIRPLSIKP